MQENTIVRQTMGLGQTDLLLNVLMCNVSISVHLSFRHTEQSVSIS
uniref:Uncharacterized protein n=1 Tax=Anguilla anguilla TaxID=7936 RepID=A0A0E9SEH4_ANGAN